MDAESYILLMLAGWLLISAAMLWGMLRMARSHAQRASLARHSDSVAEQPAEQPVEAVPATLDATERKAPIKTPAQKSRKGFKERFHLEWPGHHRHVPH
ncbi:hypothetical protein [Pseudomonas sp. RIT-PI-AD]|uniref:hypothetical protein n=1 Tax=Pseudomonas sp. RIT-PI-AD TaxID=3035294 RepID=UPI0021DA143D|nr:hypothetical protein [Pseudomonas sp. RIT-PI-AD]